MNDGEEMTVADKLRRDLKYAEDARKRAREIDSMVNWIRLSREEKTLLIQVPDHESRFGKVKARTFQLTDSDRDALMEFLTERVEREYARADGIDASSIREAARQHQKEITAQ